MFRKADRQPTSFASNLQKIESAHGSKGRLKMALDSRGRVVVEVVPSWSLILWLQNTFANKQARQALHDQALQALHSTNAIGIPIKQRLVVHITKGEFPFVNRSERRAVQAEFNSGNGLKRLNTDKIAVQKHHLLDEEQARSTAESEMQRLQARMPSVSVADAANYMRARQSCVMHDPGSAQAFAQFDQTLQAHFTRTSQERLSNTTEISITATLLEQARQVKPELFEQVQHNFAIHPEQYPEIQTYLNDLERRATQAHSATGDSIDVITARDRTTLMKLNSTAHYSIYELTNKLKEDVQAAAGNPDFLKAQNSLKNLNIARLKQDIETAQNLWLKMAEPGISRARRSSMKRQRERILVKIQPELVIAAAAREQLHHINSTLGRKWGADLLRDPEVVQDDNFSETYLALEQIEDLAGPVMYDAQLQHMCNTHDAKPHHPKVVIEGGGPVGLMTAIRQYEKGADIVVLEKRDTRYNRPQVVRLDRQWLKDLRYYLGEEFDELLSEDGRSRVQPDGSAYLVTKALENALHQRLTKLISFDSHNPPHIQRLAAHELTSVEPPEQPGGKYRVRAQYQKRYDSGETKQEQQEVFETDLLICAGGKESPTRNKFLNHCPVTHPRQYGVASWESPLIKNDELQTFPTFQNVLTTDKEFGESYQKYFIEIMHPFTGSVGPYLSHAARKRLILTLAIDEAELQHLLDKTDDDNEREFILEILADLRNGRLQQDTVTLEAMVQAIESEVCQVRTFENRNLIYLGMEIPDPTDQWMKSVTAGLDDNENREIQKILSQCWFQSAADHLGFGKTLSATLPVMNSQFTTTFPVAQDKPLDHFTVVKNAGNGPSLTVAASGDAATSPHFMTYSGLTGGRETIDALCHYTDQIASGNSYRQEIEEKLVQDYNRTATFILHKGSNFLEPRSEDEIARALQESARRQIPAPGSRTDTGFNVHDVDQDSYILSNGIQTYLIRVNENGRIQASDYNQNNPEVIDLGEFSTFRHFELEYLR